MTAKGLDESLDRLFTLGGEMGALMREVDWAATPVGPPETWPRSLRGALGLLLGSASQLCLLWGKDFTQFYNDAFRPILGAAKHPKAMGQPARECWSEIWDLIAPLYAHVAAGGATSIREGLLVLQRNGFPEECYFDYTYSPIHDESSEVVGILAICSEVTDRVLGARRMRTLGVLNARALGAQSRQLAAEAIAGALEEASSDVPFALVYLTSEDGCETRLAATVGVDRDAAGSWPLGEGEQEVELGPAQRALVLPLHSGGADRPHGYLVAGVSPRVPLDDGYRDFLRLVASTSAGIIEQARSLEREKERVEELAELDRAKTTFFGNVSHEFRTPLTLMLAAIQDMLVAPSGTTIDRPAVDLLHRNALRLLRLVNTLLEFSRIEAGRVDAQFEPVDLPTFTAEIASTFRAAITRAGLALVVDCPPLPDPVHVDRAMWEKIVLNLLSNALKFTFEGSIVVRLHPRDGAVVLEVSDTGAGIAETDIPHLFERFHRVEGVRSRSHEGSGIGLAFLHELVKIHGGRVDVTSRLGEGTSFSIAIPSGTAHLPEDRLRPVGNLRPAAFGMEAFVKEALSWSAEPGSAMSEPGAATATSSRERIVFADDNADMREYVSRLLGERWSVETVADGQAALDAVRRSPPALLLSDVMMPRLDGFGLVAAIRSDPALRTLPIILLTARLGEDETARGLGAGANDYIAKPFSARELLVRVASLLASARASHDARAAAEAQRAKLYRHFMQAPFPIAVFQGPRHVIELANPDTLRTWGKSAAIVGLPLEEAVPELRGQPYLGWLDDVFRTGVAHEGREQLARLPIGPNGELEELYSNFVYAPMRDADGVVEGILLSAFVVTEQVRARQALERALAASATSEANLRTLVDNLPELAWNARPDGTVDFFNRRWFEYTGTSPGDVVGAEWQSVHDPERVPAITTAWRESLASGRPFEMEIPLRRADGVYRWFLTRAIPLRDAAGNIVRWFGTNTDIDDLRRERERTANLSAELQFTAQRLRAAQRAATIGIFHWEVGADRMHWSPEIYRLMGIPLDSVEPSTAAWTATLVEDDRERGWRSIADAALRSERTEVEVRFHQPSGGTRWVRLSTEVECDGAGRPVRLVGAAVDVQELKEAAVVRLAALEESERVSRAKDEFLATMSHELRTPLNAILGWSKLVRDPTIEPERLGHGLRVIERNAEAQARLIADLLDVSRIISGKLRLSIERVDLATVLGAALDVVRQAADAKGVAVEAIVGPHIGALAGDPDRLQQIVWNLLSNAVKFTRPGGSVRLEADRNDSTVFIRVSDTGCGIAPEHLPLIFDRFRQVDSTTTRAQGGLGLGLAIVRNLVEAHGGSVSAASEGVGRGATLTVALPVRAVVAERRPSTDAALLGSGRKTEPPAVEQRLRGVRILVVDDEPDSLDLLTVALEAAGAHVRSASSAAAALDLAAGNAFDLLVSDIGMPGQDGYALIKTLRARGDTTPALALTAYARVEDVNRARSAGFRQHFAKPIDPKALVTALVDLLGTR